MVFNNIEEFVKYVNTLDDSIIGITSGCFDLLHPLHVEYLNKCKRECFNHLFVCVDSDKLVNEQKKKIPLINELDRAYMVDNLKAVTSVVIIDSLTDMTDVIREISSRTDRYITVFKHSHTIYGGKLITYGPKAENIIIPDVKRFQSTTEIANFLKQHYEKED